ncbi:MAG: hypothetical protein AAF434_10255 [Pseudomonadota bacterium]
MLASCGGGGGGGDSDDNNGSNSVNTGVFLDSPVEGIRYRTRTESGVTDANGTFRYRDGEIVTFSAGGLLLGGFLGRARITPIETSFAFSTEEPRVRNVIRLLQTLDDDNNPDNGIKMPPSIDTLSDAIDLDDINSVQSGVNAIGGGTLVSEADALSHFEETLSSLPAPELASSYSYTAALNVPDQCDGQRVNNATLSVTSAGGENNFSGSIDRSNGGVETFNLVGTNRGTTDAGSTIRVDADEYGAEITIRTTDFCSSVAHMTTNLGINLPPIASRNSKWTQGICQTAAGTYFYGWDMYAGDRDGFIAKHPTFIYTIEGQAEEQLIVGSNQIAQDYYGTNAAPKRTDRVEVSGIPCTSGFTWEYIVEDNEGAITTESGSVDAPFEDDGSGGGGDGDYCAEDYPQEACTLLGDDAGTTTSFSNGQSCANAFPGTDVLADFNCSGEGIFENCGACQVGVSSRQPQDASQRMIDTFFDLTK